jgi:hypothetical protein
MQLSSYLEVMYSCTGHVVFRIVCYPDLVPYLMDSFFLCTCSAYLPITFAVLYIPSAVRFMDPFRIVPVANAVR